MMPLRDMPLEIRSIPRLINSATGPGWPTASDGVPVEANPGVTGPRPVWWKALPERARKVAAEWFGLGAYAPSDGLEVRAAVTSEGALILDPVACSAYPLAWTLAHSLTCQPDFYAWRMTQCLANRSHAFWTLERGLHAGRPAYIVGNGPSARETVGLIPHRPKREGIVFAVNGAAALIPDQHDYWCVSDALWPDGDLDWLEMLLPEWLSIPRADSTLLCGLHTHHTLVRHYLRRRLPVHMYLGCHRSPYRPLLGEGRLPSFVEGNQSLIATMHMAWWLGCEPIVLFGCDFGRFPGSKRLHAAGRAGWRPKGRPPEDWWQPHEGVNSTVIETTAQMVWCAQHAAALAMWLQDEGCPVWSCSEGLDLYFTPHVDAREALMDLEGSVRDTGEITLRAVRTPLVEGINYGLTPAP